MRIKEERFWSPYSVEKVIHKYGWYDIEIPGNFGRMIDYVKQNNNKITNKDIFKVAQDITNNTKDVFGFDVIDRTYIYDIEYVMSCLSDEAVSTAYHLTKGWL